MLGSVDLCLTPCEPVSHSPHAAAAAAAGQDLYQQSITNLSQYLSCPFCCSSYASSISRCHFLF